MTGPAIELSITIPPEAADSLVGILTLHGFEGFWEDGPVLKAYIAEERWNEESRGAVARSLAAFADGQEMAPPQIETRLIPPENWNAAWEASIRPVAATDRIIIAPSWHKVEEARGRIVLTIDPKMSFGTGHHETTRLMLQLLEPRIRQGTTMLDVGTGTGVLAIAAVRLGAAAATGVDIDEWSYENARENVAANGVADRVTIIHGELADVPPGGFDVVAANIQRSVIEPMLPALRARLKADGFLLLSGLLEVEREIVEGSFQRHGLALVEERREREWIAFALLGR